MRWTWLPERTRSRKLSGLRAQTKPLEFVRGKRNRSASFEDWLTADLPRAPLLPVDSRLSRPVAQRRSSRARRSRTIIEAKLTKTPPHVDAERRRHNALKNRKAGGFQQVIPVTAESTGCPGTWSATR
jgi:hypothetical protein